MKKLISISLVLFSLSVLINCSPKTAKTTASSSDKIERTDDGAKIAPTAVEVKADVVEIKTPPVANTKTPADLSLDEQLAMYNGMAPMRVEVGQKIYTQNCGKCHNLNAPDSRAADSWVNVMKKMGPKAKLNNEQYMMVAAYLVQNSKK